MNSECGPNEDVNEIAPMRMIMDDRAFYDYIYDSNDKLAERQRIFLEKYKAYAQNPNLIDQRQPDLRSKCLEYWQIPDLKRAEKPRPSPTIRLSELFPGEDLEWIFAPENRKLDLKNLERILEFRFSVSSSDQKLMGMQTKEKPPASLLFALGKNFVFLFDQSKWISIHDVLVQIPRDTLVLAEFCKEFQGKGQGIKAQNVCRILDAAFLNGTDIREKPFEERYRLIRKFSRAITKVHQLPNYAPVKAAENFWLSDLSEIKNRSFFINVN